jgi:hypothetical protein
MIAFVPNYSQKCTKKPLAQTGYTMNYVMYKTVWAILRQNIKNIEKWHENIDEVGPVSL